MKKLIVANWKMQLSIKESLDLANQFTKKITGIKNAVVICPDYSALPFLKPILKKTGLRLGAQDCAAFDKGAYTGEVAPRNLKTLGAEYVILGHSERREHLHENSAIINNKIKAALKNKLIPILCVGEKLLEREAGQTKEVLKVELQKALVEVKTKNAGDLVIAYEPLWAIGTGQAISPEEADIIHKFIKERVSKILKKSVRVLYGGSVNLKNAPEFFNSPAVDGLLIGGASLKSSEFSKICRL